MAIVGDSIGSGVDKTIKVIDIRVNYDQAVKRMGEYRRTIDRVKFAETMLLEQLRAGAISREEYRTQMAALDTQHQRLSKSYQTLRKEVLNNIKIEKEQVGSMVRLRAELSNLTAQFDKLSRKDRESEVGQVLMMRINTITQEIKDAESATQRFYRNVGNYQSALDGVGKLTSGFSTLGKVIAGLLGGLGIEQLYNRTLQVARDFQDGMARVRAVANPLMGEFERLSDKAMELGRTTRYTASQVASGMEELSRKGLDTKATLEAIKPTLELAQANVVSIGDAAQISASAMRAFGMEAEDLSHINDILSSACSHSALNLELLGEAMKTAGPQARVANISLEETTALIGQLANIGMTGSDAGTGIKQIIMALSTARTTKKGLEILQKYNLEINETRIKTEGLLPILQEIKESGLGESTTDLKTLAGKYASPRLAAIIQNVDEAIKLNKTLQQSLGENERMFEQSTSKISKSVYSMQSAWDAFLIDVMSNSENVFSDTIDTITAFVRFLGENVRTIGNLILALIGSSVMTPLFSGIMKNYHLTIQKTQEAAKAAHIKAVAELNAIDKEYAISKRKLEEAEGMKKMARQEKDLKYQEYQAAKAVGATKDEIEAKKRLWREAMTYKKKCDADYDRAHQEFIEAQRAREEAANNKSRAESKLRLEGNLSRLGKIKASLGGVALAFKSVWSTIKSFAIWTLVFEIFEICTDLYHMVTKVSSTFKELRDNINKATNTESIKRLEAISQKLKEIDSTLKNTNVTEKEKNELLEEQDRLQNIVNGSIEDEFKKENDIITALDKQIAKVKELAKARVQADLWSKTMGEIEEIRTRNGYSTPEWDDANAAKETAEMLQERLGVRKDKQGNIMFSESKWGLTKEAWQTIVSAVTPLETQGGDVAKAIQLDRILQNLKRQGFDPNKYLLTTEGGEPETKSGPGKDTPDYSAKEKGDPYRTLLALLNKWGDKNIDLMTGNMQDGITKQGRALDDEFAKIKQDIADVLDVNNKTVQEAMAKYPDMAKKLREILASVTVEEQKKVLDAQERLADALKVQRYRLDNEMSKSRIDIEKTTLEHIRAMNIQTDEKIVMEYEQAMKESSTRRAEEEKIAQNKLAEDLVNLRLRLAKGGLGETRSKSNSLSEIDKDVQAYEKERKALDKFRDEVNLNNDDYQAFLADLNSKYEAEARYYEMRSMLAQKYNEEDLLRSQRYTNEQLDILKKMWDAELQLQLTNLETQLSELQTHYERETNLALDKNNRLTYGTDEYWERLKKRIGERDAEELNLEYQKYQAELADFNAFGDKKYQTQEAYEARKAELEKQGEAIHTKANQAIIKSDEARWQAANQMLGGLIQITEAAGENDKDAAKLAKVLALAQIAISTGEAIAKMTSAEASKGVLGIGTAAAGIATILANIATAITTVKSAKFAHGVVNLQGPGTSTSDSIPAMLSRGESVMTARATQMWGPVLTAMNAFGNGVALPRPNYIVQPDQMADLGETLINAYSEIRPVVDVQEITRTQNRVEVIQNLDTF